MSQSIPELLQVPGQHRDIDWLRAMLRHAVKLEFATIPPYLCGLWSIKSPSAPGSSVVYGLIRGIVLQEMVHMGLACNMLTTIGGTPEINANLPTYPGTLPGGVQPDLRVYLAGLSRELVANVYMKIEQPAWTPLDAGLAATTYKSIGEFYEAIRAEFPRFASNITGERQLQMQIGNDEIFPIATLEDAEKAIQEITEQGEGTQKSPLDLDPDDELAHYYRFAEIYEGRYFRQGPDGRWAYDGPVIPFPDAYPMAEVPPGGYPGLLQELRFRQQFTTVLDCLQGAWETGDQGKLNNGIAFMFTLGPLAQQLMQIPLPDGGGNYGPDFQLYSRGATGEPQARSA